MRVEASRKEWTQQSVSLEQRRIRQGRGTCQCALTRLSAIAKETSYKAEVQQVDFGSFESVIALTKRLKGDPLDILVENIGMAAAEYSKTKDGWEQTYGITLVCHAAIH